MGAALSSVSPPVKPPRMSIREDAEPVSTYREARGWLWRNVPPADMEGIVDRNHPLPPVMRLVAAVFWVGEEKLRADLRRDWNGY